MARRQTTLMVDSDLQAKFMAINVALGISNNKVYERLIEGYVQEHYDDYQKLAKAQAEADKLKAKITGGK